MTSESEQLPPRTTDTAGSGDAGARPKAGVPVWRTGKPDAVLAAAVDVARNAVEGIAPDGRVGRHLAARSEGDRLVTHLFECTLPGYLGWQWYAVLTRNSRSKVMTVDELGLLPSEDSILAPAWIPWAERVRPEDAQDEEPAEADTGAVTAGEPRDESAGELTANAAGGGGAAGHDTDDVDSNSDDEPVDEREAAPKAD